MGRAGESGEAAPGRPSWLLEPLPNTRKLEKPFARLMSNTDSAVWVLVPSLLDHVALGPCGFGESLNLAKPQFPHLHYGHLNTCQLVYEDGFIHSFIHSSSKHLLSTCCVPGTVLGAGDTALNKTDTILALVELSF